MTENVVSCSAKTDALCVQHVHVYEIFAVIFETGHKNSLSWSKRKNQSMFVDTDDMQISQTPSSDKSDTVQRKGGLFQSARQKIASRRYLILKVFCSVPLKH
jgi:hypothetical protein